MSNNHLRTELNQGHLEPRYVQCLGFKLEELGRSDNLPVVY